MFDIFYFGKKPELFAHERFAASLEDAAEKSRTKLYWYIYGNYDSTDVDFDYIPPPWEFDHIHVWPSQWHQYGGLYLANKNSLKDYKWQFHNQVVFSVSTKSNWNLLEKIDENSWDWSWVPHPKDPPYIYVFGNQWHPSARMPTLEYQVPGATQIKYMDQTVHLLENFKNWNLPEIIDRSSIDFSWVPDPLDPPYIYHFPSQWQSSSGVTYTVPGAVNIKLVDHFVVKALPQQLNWIVPDNIDNNSVDYSWHPNPLDPPYIYHFPSQWQSSSGVTYTVPGAQKIKLVDYFTVTSLPQKDNWYVPESVGETSVDYSWHPNPLDPPYIYHFPSQWQSSSGVTYTVPGSHEIKLVDHFVVKTVSSKESWTVPSNVNPDSINYSWHPNPLDPPYVYHFPSQHQSSSGVIYTVPGATDIKLIEHFTVRSQSDTSNWQVPDVVDTTSIDYSWHPNPIDNPYIYEFATQHQPNGGARYVVPGATKIKYVELAHKRLPNKDNWQVPDVVDTTSIDYSWHPDSTEMPYIYEFATQHQPNGGARYVVPGATETKYVELAHKRLPNKDNWETNANIESFDYSWHPSNTEKPYVYIFGNQYYPGAIMPSVIYWVPGASEEKFIDRLHAKLKPSRDNWNILEPIAEDDWDWCWVPNPKDPPYIYVFGNQWNPPEYKSSIIYQVPGATEKKYLEPRTKRLPQPQLFRHNLAVSEFDYSWEPNPFDPPLIYVFGNQWNPAVLEPTVVYNVQGATETKYMDEPVARLAQDISHWELLDDIEEFDYSWRPDPTDPPYIYIFGNQWLDPEQRPALKYTVPDATEIKYMDEPKAQRKGSPEKFITHHDCEFDYSWEPDPGSPPYIYIFGNQHWPAEVMPTVEYHVAGATETKYMDEPCARLQSTKTCWHSLTDLPFDFDYSWCPDPGDPPFIYQFGNQWYSAEEMPTVQYTVKGAVEIKYVDSIQARLLPVMDRWTIPEEVDSTNIDFSWTPHPKDDPYIHHFGSDYQISTGLTYTVPGATEPKFEGEPPKLIKEKITIVVVDIFYVDRSNSLSADRYKKLQEKYPGIQKIRYANSMLETVRRCVTRAKTRKFWVISSLNIYNDFDFAWHAEPWQNYMTHVFPSQWNKWSDTFLVNKYEFERHSKWAQGIEEFPNLNFVKNQTVQSASDGSNIYYVDHGNQTDQFDVLKSKFNKIKSTRFVDNYLDTFKRIMTTADTEYVWIVSSICRYDSFDFSWYPEAWQAEMIHVFASGSQKRGDTFYIHVESFKKQMYELELLDWFNVINYCQDQQVHRLEPPIIHYTGDSLVEPVKNTAFNFPYAVFYNKEYEVISGVWYPCLWAAKDRVIESITVNKSCSVVPREARSYIKTQIYDYPYIVKDTVGKRPNKPLDIIFISNGEPDEELMFHHTEYMTNSDVKWIRGVNGRVAAYQAAAQASTTPWFFAVFAKLEVIGNTFPWYDWQPDYWQESKHYIFNARNPVNGLEYGHQGMIAYNKQLVLDNNSPGIDFTLSQPHEAVPLLSGVARFNQDPWTTWRTAFREVVKLKHFMSTQPTLETEHRLETWLTIAKGDFSEWCLLGATDAANYYDEVDGDYEKLMCSFEWVWLRDRFKNLYNV